MFDKVQVKWIVACLLLLAFQAGGQNLSRIDTLKNQLNQVSGERKFEVLNDLGFEYRLSFPDSTIFYCKQAYDLGKRLQLSKNLSKPLSFIGLANAYKGDYKSSFDYHKLAIEVAEEQQDSIQLGYCYNNFGRLFFDQGDLSRAYDNFIKCQEIFELVNEEVGMAYVYRSLSNLYKSQGDYTKALQSSLKAYELRRKIGDPRTLMSSLSELGLVYSELKSKADANRCFQQADSIAQKVQDFISLAEIRIGWSEFLSNNDNIMKADTLAHLAYSMVNKTSNTRLMPRVSLLMGQVHYKQKQYDEAIVYLKNSIAKSGSGHLDLQRDAHFYLAQIYEHKGNKAEATQNTNRYLILKESLQSVELARQIEKLQFQLEIEKKESENALLKANEARNDAIISQQRLEKFILIGAVVIASALFFVQYRSSKRRRAINEKLESQNREIEKQRLEIVFQNEKLEKHNHELSDINHEKDTLMNIVAHDLKSPLNRIKGLSDLIEIEGSLNTNQGKYLNLIRDSTRSGLDLIVDLLDVNSLEVNREPKYSSFNLSNFLHDRINSFKHYAAVKEIDLQLKENGIDDIFLDQDYLARILDNLISNAIKFSPRNSVVILSAEKSNDFYSLKVKDKGPGFSSTDRKFLFQKFKKLSARPTAGESSNGLGLAIVKILVDRMGGDINLQSDSRTGSEFTVRFPVKANVMA
jgi:signal transduction histidine kinase